MRVIPLISASAEPTAFRTHFLSALKPALAGAGCFGYPGIAAGGGLRPDHAPPAWRERAAEGLSRAYGFTLRDTGHAVVGRGACPARLIRTFLDNPAVPPDGRCVEQIGPPAFR